MKKVDNTAGNSIEAMSQQAALCFRAGIKTGTEVLLVTSRDTGRWVIPKGWPCKGKDAAESARQEAFEEGGVEGDIVTGPIGLYTYDKVMSDGSLQPCVVSVYPIAVSRLRSNFPERHQRKRRWFSPKKAARKVAEPELRAILAAFDPAQLVADRDEAGAD